MLKEHMVDVVPNMVIAAKVPISKLSAEYVQWPANKAIVVEQVARTDAVAPQQIQNPHPRKQSLL